MSKIKQVVGSFRGFAGVLGLIGVTVLAVTIGLGSWRTNETHETGNTVTAILASSTERGSVQTLSVPGEAIVAATQSIALDKSRSTKAKARRVQRTQNLSQASLGTLRAVDESHLSPAPSLIESGQLIGVTPPAPVAISIIAKDVSDREVQCQNGDENEATLRRLLGWSFKSLAKAQGLTRLSPAAICALPLLARDQLRVLVKEMRKASANGMMEYLESRHLDDSGKVPADALYKAVQQHRAMVIQQSGSAHRSAPLVAGISPPVWTAMGPTNSTSGRVNALHIDPRNSAIMLAGTATGGLWRTVDAGATWLPVDGFSPAFSNTGLRVDPKNPDIIYLSTGSSFGASGGLWRSLDNGLTWHSIPGAAAGQVIPGRTPGAGATVTELVDVAISPADSQIIVSAARPGVLVSSDGGSSWQQVAGKANYGTGYSNLPNTYFVSFDPKNARKVYAGTDRGTVIVGTGLGTGSEQWQEQTIAAQTSGTLVTTMAWSKDGGIAWISTSEAKGTVYRSTDGGLTFATISAPEYCGNQCWYNNSLWVDPTNSNRIVLGGVGLRRSVDGGMTWESIDYGLNYSWTHVDYHAVLADPGYNGTTNKTIYFGNDGGVYRTTDITAPAWNVPAEAPINPSNALTWENFGKGINATQFYAIDGNSTTGAIFGGTQDNGTFRFQSGSDWDYFDGGDGGYPGVPNSGLQRYTSIEYLQISRTPYSSANPLSDVICDGITDATPVSRVTWNPITNTFDAKAICGVQGQAPKSLFIAPLILDPNNDKRMYAGGASLWASNDVSTGAPVWRAIKGALAPDQYGSSTYVSSIAVTPGDSNLVWVGYTNGEVYRTANALAVTPTWVLAKAATPGYKRFITSIFVSPTASQRVTITHGGYSSTSGSNNVFRTMDAGATWTDISGNLPKAVANSVVELPTNPNFLYVGTDVGIYATTDGITWSTSNDGPAMVPVLMLKWYDSSTLLAATFGRGVWRATIGNVMVGAPTQVIGSPADSQVAVSFVAPLIDGGSPITGYTVTSIPAGGVDSNAGSLALTHTITGLHNGTAYAFTVKATNVAGESVASTPSDNVTPAQTGIPAIERAALLNLFASTNGPSWINKTNWSGPGWTECTWYGVTCDATQAHITGIALTNNHLVGTLPSISDLKDLKSYLVENNQLNGPVPSLSGLTALQMFSVAENQFLSGPIPSLSGLTALKFFHVSGNQLTGAIPSLSGLTALQSLHVGRNQLTGPIPSLGGLTALQIFVADSNQLTGPMPDAPNSLVTGGSHVCDNSLVSNANPAINAIWGSAAGNWLSCQVAGFKPSCTLTATPSTILAGGSSSLAASCVPDAVSYMWTGGNCAGTNAASCSVTPSATTTYTVRGGNSFGNGVAAIQTVTIAAINPQSISLTNPGTKNLGAAPLTLSATGGASGNPVTFSSQTASVCTVSGSTATLVGVGTCTIAADQAGNASYAVAPQVTQSFAVNALISQTISFTNPGSKTLSAAPFALIATGGASANPVTFSSQTTGVCTVSGSTATMVGVGTCTISADQTGNASYAEAPQVTQSFSVTSVRLINLSTRGKVLTGDNVMIGGFIIGGSTPKKVLVRAVGPALANAGVPGVLADPNLQLFSGQTQLASNNDWGSAANAVEIQASGLAPSNPKESAILATLSPGPYTAIVSGAGNVTGVAIVEVFELDHPEIPLINISTRGQVLTGANVMIGGFIIQGDSAQSVLIRVGGPSLTNYGVTGVLANPQIVLYSGQTPISSNDNWQSAANVAAITASGLAPANPLESAILTTLQPGAYTAIVSGADGGTGVAIIEVFAQ